MKYQVLWDQHNEKGCLLQILAGDSPFLFSFLHALKFFMNFCGLLIWIYTVSREEISGSAVQKVNVNPLNRVPTEIQKHNSMIFP